MLALGSDLLIAELAGGAGAEWYLGVSAWRWMFLVETLAGVIFEVLARTGPSHQHVWLAPGPGSPASPAAASRGAVRVGAVEHQ